MPIRRRHRGADSPLDERVTHVIYDGASRDVTTPDGCWDIVVRRRRGAIQILQTELITRPIPLDYEPGDEYLSISFKPGVFMPTLPGIRMLDHAFFRPTVGRRAFWLDGHVLEIPVMNALDGDLAALSSPRTAQRRFRRVLGITPKALQPTYT